MHNTFLSHAFVENWLHTLYNEIVSQPHRATSSVASTNCASERQFHILHILSFLLRRRRPSRGLCPFRRGKENRDRCCRLRRGRDMRRDVFSNKMCIYPRHRPMHFCTLGTAFCGVSGVFWRCVYLVCFWIFWLMSSSSVVTGEGMSVWGWGSREKKGCEHCL
jgi:hypothetical protein